MHGFSIALCSFVAALMVTHDGINEQNVAAFSLNAGLIMFRKRWKLQLRDMNSIVTPAEREN